MVNNHSIHRPIDWKSQVSEKNMVDQDYFLNSHWLYHYFQHDIVIVFTEFNTHTWIMIWYKYAGVGYPKYVASRI